MILSKGRYAPFPLEEEPVYACPSINIDKLWLLLSEQTRTHYATKTDKAPVIDCFQAGFYSSRKRQTSRPDFSADALVKYLRWWSMRFDCLTNLFYINYLNQFVLVNYFSLHSCFYQC